MNKLIIIAMLAFIGCTTSVKKKANYDFRLDTGGSQLK